MKMFLGIYVTIKGKIDNLLYWLNVMVVWQIGDK